MKRTAILRSLELNEGKFQNLCQFVDAYAKQKDAFLVQYAHLKSLDKLKSNELRDSLVESEFQSPFGLKARAWKLALKDALQTIRMYWETATTEVIKYIYRRFQGSARTYATWLLGNAKRIRDVVTGKMPSGKPVGKFKLAEPEKRQTLKYVRRKLTSTLGSRPRVKIRRSLCLDADMYRTFEETVSGQPVSANLRSLAAYNRSNGCRALTAVAAGLLRHGHLRCRDACRTGCNALRRVSRIRSSFTRPSPRKPHCLRWGGIGDSYIYIEAHSLYDAPNADGQARSR